MNQTGNQTGQQTGHDTSGYPVIGRDVGSPRYAEDRYNDPYPSGAYGVLPEPGQAAQSRPASPAAQARPASPAYGTTGDQYPAEPYPADQYGADQYSGTDQYAGTGQYATGQYPEYSTGGYQRPTHEDLQQHRRVTAATAEPEDDYPPVDRSSMVDPLESIEEISAVVESARAVPMSANCMVNRNELLGLLDELRANLPAEIRKAQALLDERDQVIASGQREADRIIAEGEQEHRRLVSIAEVTVSAEHEASRIIAEARSEAQSLRDEIEEYVDTTLANFEQMLQRTMATVERGRDKMRALSEIGSFDSQSEDKPLPF
jgi:cell division septum initiation protein DivIVA